MSPVERKDLYKLLTGLSNKLCEIAESTDDFETSDKLEGLIEVITDSADQVIFNRE